MDETRPIVKIVCAMMTLMTYRLTMFTISLHTVHSKSLNDDALKLMNRDHSSEEGKRFVRIHVSLCSCSCIKVYFITC